MAREDHARVVLAAVLPGRKDRLSKALTTLEEDHFRDTTTRNLWKILVRYFDMTGDVIPLRTMSDLLSRSGQDAAKALAYEALYEELAERAVEDHSFTYSMEALKDERAESLTGEAITTSLEILQRGVEIDRVEHVGHQAAREYLYGELGRIDRLASVEAAPEGDVRTESDAILQDYADRKAGIGVGAVQSGITTIDAVTSGFQNGELILVCAYTGEGKMAALDTPVLTPTGWCAMGDLEVGDALVNSAGRASRVRALHPQGEMQLYRVTFSDGTSTECGGPHLWRVQDNNERNNEVGGRRRLRGNTWRVLSTDQIREALEEQDRSDFFIPMTAPVEFTERGLLSIDPYLLGALLGDGTMLTTLGLCSVDEGIVLEVTEALAATGEGLKPVGNGKDWTVVGSGATRAALRHLGCWGKRSWEKFVPDEFLYSSVESRLSLLQGLMDTDGTVNEEGGGVEFSTTSERLARDVQFLAESLGGTATVGEREGSYVVDGVRHEARRNYRVALKLPEEVAPFAPMVPFRLGRKVERYELRREGATQGRRSLPYRKVVSVEPSRVAEAQCLTTTAPDNLYLTDHCIVTHNSQMSTQVAWDAMVRQGKNVFFATSETVREQVRRRLLARHSLLEGFEHPGGLDSARIKNGTLDEAEEEVLRRVVEDFATNPTYGRMHVAQVPRGATLGYVEAKLARAQQRWDVGLVVVDYLALLKPDRKRQNNREELNDILKDAKAMAVSHDGGRGVPLVSPWQMSQSAYKDALRSGEYTLANLADTSEAEKSSDSIISLLRMPDTPGEVKAQMLKVRDSDRPAPFTLEIDYRVTYLGTREDRSVSAILSEESQSEPWSGESLDELLG